MKSSFLKSILCEFSSQELIEELARRKTNRKDFELELYYAEIKNFNLGDITTKDFAVHWDDQGQYSFYLLKDGVEHNLSFSDAVAEDWWPKIDGDDAAQEFIPHIFHEVDENVYLSTQEEEKTKEILAKCGFLSGQIVKDSLN